MNEFVLLKKIMEQVQLILIVHSDFWQKIENRERERERQTDRQTDTLTNKQRQTDRDRQTDRQSVEECFVTFPYSTLNKGRSEKLRSLSNRFRSRSIADESCYHPNVGCSVRRTL